MTPRGYQYQKITDQEIRLLHLHPAQNVEDGLIASISVENIDEIPEYEAISYTWGTARSSISVKSESIEVPASLVAALQNFRYKTRERTLWVDAICIDLENLPEKSSQVGMMDKIFGSAVNVLIWLGHGDARVKQAIQGYRSLAAMLNENRPDMRIADSARLQNNPDASDNVMSRLNEHIASYEMHLLYEVLYFTRTWIVQEAAVARSLSLFYDNLDLEWTDFTKVMATMKCLGDSGAIQHQNLKAFRQAWAVVHARDLYEKVKKSTALHDFAELVDIVRGRDCSRDEDRIYALMNLQPANLRFPMKPSYSSPTIQVLLQYSRASLVRGYLDVLYDAGTWYRNADDIDPTEMIPSWIPDYRVSSPRPRLPWLRNSQHFKSSLQSPSAFGGVLSEMGWDLQVDAIRCGSVAEKRENFLLAQAETVDDDETILTKTCAHIQACREMFHRYAEKHYPTKEATDQAFWNTIVVGGIGDVWQGNSAIGDPSAKTIHESGERFRIHFMSPKGGVAGQALGDSKAGLKHTRDHESEAAACFYASVKIAMDGVVFFVTDNGISGLGPPGMQTDDVIVTIAGSIFPFVFRPMGLDPEDDDLYIIVGPCFIHSFASLKLNANKSEAVRVM